MPFMSCHLRKNLTNASAVNAYQFGRDEREQYKHQEEVLLLIVFVDEMSHEERIDADSRHCFPHRGPADGSPSTKAHARFIPLSPPFVPVRFQAHF